MLGSLNKVWPWKQTLESTLNRHGKEIPLVQENILPDTFEAISGQPAYLSYSICLMFTGLIIVLLLGKNRHKTGKMNWLNTTYQDFFLKHFVGIRLAFLCK